MAINRRFPISDEQRQLMVDRAFAVLETSTKSREIIAAEKVLVAMESLNQKDEHKQLDEFSQRIIALANQFGIDLTAIGISQQTGAGPGNGVAGITATETNGTR